MANATIGAATTPLTLAAETAEELMRTNPVSIPADASIAEAVAVLTDRGFSAAPVIDEASQPLGVISRTDILIHKRERLAQAPNAACEAPAGPVCVSAIMTPAIFSVTTGTPARTVIEQMPALKVHHLFVVDDSGVLIGVISPLDVLKRLV
ncbi:MAG TPA: CBS domain-containing protein [Gemmataceae bacterium]|nr:CBS domain-containing protein [Gemmataceae bacterium]